MSYAYKLYIGFLFVLFGVLFVLRDYGIISFRLDHFTFILIVVGIALLAELIKKAEEYFRKPKKKYAKQPVKKNKIKRTVRKPTKKKTIKRKPKKHRKTKIEKQSEPWGIRKILKRESSEKAHYKRYIKPIEQEEKLRR